MIKEDPTTYLMINVKETMLWHQKPGDLNLKSMKKIVSEEAAKGLSKFKIEEDKVCGEFQIRKQAKTPHKKLNHLATTKVLELLHMDLMGHMQVESLEGKRYVFVCVDGFSRYTWVKFIREKYDMFEVFKELCQLLQREKWIEIIKIRSDHNTEFKDSKFSEFYASEGISHEFYAPITPQQNGVVEIKNKTLQESSRVMLHAKKLPYYLCIGSMNKACHIHNLLL